MVLDLDSDLELDLELPPLALEFPPLAFPPLAFDLELPPLPPLATVLFICELLLLALFETLLSDPTLTFPTLKELVTFPPARAAAILLPRPPELVTASLAMIKIKIWA